MIRALLAAAFCFFVGTASAANIDPRLAKYDVCGRFEVFHINGIMTTRIQAGQNRDRIRVVYGNAYNGHLIFYGLGYNQTRGFATDLYQSALQVISGYAGATWDKFMNAVTFSVYSIGMPEATAKAIAKVVTDKYAFTKPSPYQDQDLTDIMNEINSQTAGGANAYHKARKVFVPHSQGNLYMNLVYDKLIANGTPAASMGVVGMAVPYSSVRSGNNHVTSWNDVVVDATRLPTLNNIVTPNVTIPYQPSIDVLGHNLIATYLANSTAVSMMNTRITSEFGTLKTTVTPSASDGTFIGQASWADCRYAGGIIGAYTPTRPYEPCGYDTWLEPIVTFFTAGGAAPNWGRTTRPGLPAETTALATAQVNACIASGATHWNTLAMTGTVTGDTWNCGLSPYKNYDLARRYGFYRSGDSTVTTTTNWVNPYGTPPTSYGNTTITKRPVCRN